MERRFALNPIAFRIGPIPVYWYGLFAASAVIIGYAIASKNMRRYGLSEETVDGMLIRLIFSIFIGARLGYVLVNIPYFLGNPWEIIRFDHGGLGSHGAILATLIMGVVWTKKYKLSYLKIADAVAPALPIGHIFIRLGNYFNGELYGSPTHLPWGVVFPGLSEPVHPVQLYEMGLSILILPFALKWSKAPRYPGYAFLRVILIHSVIRFFLDFIRRHSSLIGPFVLTQIIALLIVIASAVIIFYLKKRWVRTEK